MWSFSPRSVERTIVSLFLTDYVLSRIDNVYVEYAVQELALRATFHRILAHLISSAHSGDSLLESDCGYDYPLDEAESHFRFRAGTGYPADSVEEIRIYTDQKYISRFDTIDKSGRFDCINAANVNEHVYQPHILEAGGISGLRPGGVLILSDPDHVSCDRESMSYWRLAYKVPERILYFVANTLTLLLLQTVMLKILIQLLIHKTIFLRNRQLLYNAFGLTTIQTMTRRLADLRDFPRIGPATGARNNSKHVTYAAQDPFQREEYRS